MHLNFSNFSAQSPSKVPKESTSEVLTEDLNDSISNDIQIKRKNHVSLADGYTPNCSIIPIKDQISTSKTRSTVDKTMKTKDGKRKSIKSVITKSKHKNDTMCASAQKSKPSTKSDHRKSCKMSEETVFIKGKVSKTTSVSTTSHSITQATSIISDSTDEQDETFPKDITDSIPEHALPSITLSSNKTMPLTQESPSVCRNRKSSKNKFIIQQVRK